MSLGRIRQTRTKAGKTKNNTQIVFDFFFQICIYFAQQAYTSTCFFLLQFLNSFSLVSRLHSLRLCRIFESCRDFRSIPSVEESFFGDNKIKGPIQWALPQAIH